LPCIIALLVDNIANIYYNFVVNMEMGYLTPPFGFNLFHMKGVVPQGITMVDIYKSAIPFIVVQAITLVLVMIFPKIILVIPNLIFG